MLSRYIRSWGGYKLHIGSNLPPKDNLRKEDKISAPKVSFIRRFHCISFRGVATIQRRQMYEDGIWLMKCGSCIARAQTEDDNNVYGIVTAFRTGSHISFLVFRCLLLWFEGTLADSCACTNTYTKCITHTQLHCLTLPQAEGYSLATCRWTGTGAGFLGNMDWWQDSHRVHGLWCNLLHFQQKGLAHSVHLFLIVEDC